VADHANYLSDSSEEIETKHLVFSDAAKDELARVIPAVRDIYTMALDCYLSDDAGHAEDIAPLRIVISEMCDKFKSNHVERLATGVCTTEQGFVFNDILYSCVRIAEHSLNIAAIAYRFKSAGNTNPDTYMHDFKQRKDKDEKKYQEYVRKYNA
jgi:phosphate:Na+ symporter